MGQVYRRHDSEEELGRRRVRAAMVANSQADTALRGLPSTKRTSLLPGSSPNEAPAPRCLGATEGI